jgi:hypothetical protein
LPVSKPDLERLRPWNAMTELSLAHLDVGLTGLFRLKPLTGLHRLVPDRLPICGRGLLLSRDSPR